MEAISDQVRADFDAIPYAAAAYCRTHPDNLSTIGALAGLIPAPVTACRVLELGCGVGGNLLPMAQALSGSRFLGIDLSPRQVESGNAVIQKLGLSNIALRCQDIMEFAEDEGEFDYIIAHGVYSWVPADVRDRLMQIIARHLSPRGLAYVSYNTLPGWHLRQMFRDMTQFHARKAGDDPMQRLAKAREMIGFATQPAVAPIGYKETMQDAARLAAPHGDFYLLHEYLAPVNGAVYFEQFVRHASEHALRHIAPASPSMETFNWLPPPMQRQVAKFSSDPVEREQYLDFLHGRLFRSSILVRADAVANLPTDAEAVRSMYAAGHLLEIPPDPSKGDGFIRFGGRQTDKQIPAREPWILAMFNRIRAAWPRAVPFAELLDLANAAPGPHTFAPGRSFEQTVAHHVFVSHKAEVLELWTRPIDFISPAGHQPSATPLARHQAVTERSLANLRHEAMTVNATMFHFLPLLDGTRDRTALRRALRGLIESGTVTPAGGMPSDVAQLLERTLNDFAADSLLIA